MIKKLTASFLILTSALTYGISPAYSSSEISLSPSSRAEIRIHSLAETIQIPPHLGTLQKHPVLHAASPKAPLIIHLQDAHASFEAQVQIKNILHYLSRYYGVQTFFLEGASGQLDSSALRFSASKEENLRSAQFLAERGVLSGGEWALAESGSLQGFGVEDSELYKKNLAQYQWVLQNSKPALRVLSHLRAQVMKESSRLFSPKLYKLFKTLRTNQSLIRQTALLSAYAAEELKLDFKKPGSQIQWPQWARFIKCQGILKDLDLKKAAQEKETLSEWLSRQGFEVAYRKAIDDLVSPEKTYKNWHESPRDFLERLYQTASPKGFEFKNYPRLRGVFAAAVLESEIEPAAFQNEIELLKNLLYSRLARNTKEKDLLERDRRLERLEKLFRLELTPAELAKIESDKSALQPFKGLKKANRVYRKALQFYRDAKKRDQAMFRRVIQQMKSQGLDKAVLITGGFHAPGLRRAFESSKTAYLEVLPRLASQVTSKSYQEKMLYEPVILKTAHIPLPRVMDSAGDYGRDYERMIETEFHLARQSVDRPSVLKPRSELRSKAEDPGKVPDWIRDSIRKSTLNFFNRDFAGLEQSTRPLRVAQELPLPVSYQRVLIKTTPVAKVELILQGMLEEMQSSDKTLVRKMAHAVQSAVRQLMETLSEGAPASARFNSDVMNQLNQDYLKNLRHHVEAALRELHQEAQHAHSLPDSLRLTVSPQIDRKHRALPRLLKHYLSEDEKLLSVPVVSKALEKVSGRLQKRVDLAAEIDQQMETLLDRISEKAEPSAPLTEIPQPEIPPRPEGPAKAFDPEARIKITTEIPPPETSDEVLLNQGEVERKQEEEVSAAEEKAQADIAELTQSLQEAVQANNQVVMKILREALKKMKSVRQGKSDSRSELRSAKQTTQAASSDLEDPFPSLEEIKDAQRQNQLAKREQGFIPRINLADYLLGPWLRMQADRNLARQYNALRQFHESREQDQLGSAPENLAYVFSLISPESFRKLCRLWMIQGQDWKLSQISGMPIVTGHKKLLSRILSNQQLLTVQTEFHEKFSAEPETLQRFDEDFEVWLEAAETSAHETTLEDVRILRSLLNRFERYDEISFWMEALWASRRLGLSIEQQEFETRYAAFKSISSTLASSAEHFGLMEKQAGEVYLEASRWISELPAWARSRDLFDAVVRSLSRIHQTAPNADWYCYGLKVLFSIPVNSRIVFAGTIGTYFEQRTENGPIYSLLKNGLLGMLESDVRSRAEESFTQIQEALGEPEAVTSTLHLITGPLSRIQRTQYGQDHILPQLEAVADCFRRDPVAGRAVQAARYYLDKEDAKGALLQRMPSEAADRIRSVDALIDKNTAEIQKAKLGIFHYLLERLDHQEAASEDILRLMSVIESAARSQSFMTLFLSWETLFKFYFSISPASRPSLEKLPEYLDQLAGVGFKVQKLFPSLLEVLLDPGIPPQERLEKLKALKAEFDVIEMGYPVSTAYAWDIVSLQGLFASGITRKMLERRSHEPIVQAVLSKAGPKGLQTYWESEKPDYYVRFLEETEGIPESFFSPGEKFRFSYARASAGQAGDQTLAPVENPVAVMKKLIQDLRWRHPTLYDNFIAPKRALLQGRNLEEVIDGESVQKVAKQFIAKLQDWPIQESEKLPMSLEVLGVLFHPELEPVLSATAEDSLEEKLARYWSDFLNLIKQKGYLRERSKLQIALQNEVKKRVFSLVSDQTEGREGVIQVMLTRGSLSDFFRGEISRDCTAEGQGKFEETLGLPADPAFLSLKFVENGLWTGNVYAMLFKVTDSPYHGVKKGEYVVYIDQIAMHPKSSLAHRGSEFGRERELFTARFYEGLENFLAINGIQHMMLANDPSVLDHMRTALQREIANRQLVQMRLQVTKPGGLGHLKDFHIGREYIQAIGVIQPEMVVGGFLAKLNVEDARAAEMKRREAEFKNFVKIRNQELEAILQEGARYEEDSAKVALAVDQYQQKGRKVTALVLQEALDHLLEKRRKLQAAAQAKSDEITALEENRVLPPGRDETRVNQSRSEVRSGGDEDSLTSGFDLRTYQGAMLRLKSRASDLAARIKNIEERLQAYRKQLEDLSRQQNGQTPALPTQADAARKGSASRKQAWSSEESKNWWQDFLHGKVTRLAVRPLAPSERRLSAEELQSEIAQMEREKRLEEDELANRNRKLETARTWLDDPNRGAANNPFLELEEAAKKIQGLLGRVSPEVWNQLKSHFPDKAARAFNLNPRDVAHNLLQAWETSDYFGNILNILAEHGSLSRWFPSRQTYQDFKIKTSALKIIPEFDRPGTWARFEIPSDPARYSLVLSDRGPEYLLRGFFSGDCTNCGPHYNTASFLSATTTHIADPGFLNFKMMRDGEWIGNVYALVIEDAGQPVLLVDAIQIPWQGYFWDHGASPLFLPFDLSETRFPVEKSRQAFRIAAASLLALNRYAETAGFRELWLSSFVSNFSAIKELFSSTLMNEDWDRFADADKKIGDWQVLKQLGYFGRPYVESLAYPKARLLWPHSEREAKLEAFANGASRSELRIFPGIGIRLKPENAKLLDQAIHQGHQSEPLDLNDYLSGILSGLVLDANIQTENLLKLLQSVQFKLTAVKPARSETSNPPSPGLGLDFEGSGNDVFTAVHLEEGDAKHQSAATIYAGYGIYELASDVQKKQLILHGFYLAYRALAEFHPGKYFVEIDLERLIDQRIAQAADKPQGSALNDLKFQGFENGVLDRKDILTRARFFADLASDPSGQNFGGELSSLLQTVVGLEKQFRNSGMFAYVEGGVSAMLEGNKIERLMAVTEYIGEHRREDIGEFLDEKIQAGKDILILNTGAPTPLILSDVKKMVEHLAQGNRLRNLHLDLPPSLQGDIEKFLASGQLPAGFLEKIAKRFPPFLPKEFARSDLYVSILRAVYEHNQDAPATEKIRVSADYEPPAFPFRPLPKQSGAAILRALQKEAVPGTVTLFINPMEELLSLEFSNHPRVASVLHIDRTTGFGPEKEVNQLALFMSEGGGPKKTFALPIYPGAPFYQEAIHAGVPEGLPFNLFRSYAELIMSTAEEGGDQEKEVPQGVSPQTTPRSPDLVPRSEVRDAEGSAVVVARDVAEKIVRPGLPGRETRFLIEQVAPEAFLPFNQQERMNPVSVNQERAFLSAFFTDNRFRQKEELPPALSEKDPEVRGRVILSSAPFQASGEILKPLLQFFSLEASSEGKGISAPYIFAGKSAGMLEAGIRNAGLNILDQHTLRKNIRFARDEFASVVEREAKKIGKVQGLILSASPREAAPFAKKIFSVLEREDAFLEPGLSLEQNASAYYVRARLLKQLAGELAGFYLKAASLKRAVSDRDVLGFVANFFRQNLGMEIWLDRGDTLDLSLSNIHSRLEIYRAAYKQIRQAA